MTNYTDLKTRLGMVNSDLQGRIDATKLQVISEALAAIEELEARNQWQPIATAPKDGTEIQVVVVDTDGKMWQPDTAWWCDSSGRWENGADYDEWPITHWMPLPQPPEQDQ